MFRYYSETDTLSIYLVKATAGLIAESDEVVPGLLVDYTSDNKIVAIDIWKASNRTPAHFWDHGELHDGKPPLRLQTEYDATHQQFIIAIVDDPCRVKLAATDDERITVWEDSDGRWTSIMISNAAETVASPGECNCGL